ncbi:serine hydrolase domain-containing protein [Streptomyces sp. NPDC087440]|uniref:serine hydrolase domain-containing protein n=1 Tax=Streptomyces sp. NPDC087440 TaxID=3365790 RepID=UPI0037FC5587
MTFPAARAALAAALLVGLTAGPLAAPALAHERPAVAADQRGPDRTALEKALKGLPDSLATSAIVRVGGHGTWRGSAGVRDVRTGAKVIENARFRAGSTTKVVTAALVLKLAAQGRIDLDGTVQQYLPGLLTSDFAPITVRQLLNYTSGLQPGKSLGDTVDESYPHRFETLTPQEVVAASVAQGPGHAPGAEQRYGNIHYLVLAMIVEKATGDTYAHQAEVQVLRPLGMRDTSFPAGGDPRIHGPHNRGYEDMDGRLVDVTEWNVSDRWAAGDMISTLPDLERLMVGLIGGRLLPQAQRDELFAVPDLPGARYGAGLERIVVNGREVWGKTGARPGYHTVVAATKTLDRTLVYSVTATDAHTDGLVLAQRFAFPAFNR